MRSLLSCCRTALVATVVAVVALAAGSAQANDQPRNVQKDVADARANLVSSVAVVERVRGDENFESDIESFLHRARAVMVVPRFYRGGFILGGAYGLGSLIVRDDSGVFSAPAFFELAGGSLGFQIGAQRAEMIYLIMTDAGLDAILSDRFKVGAGAGVSVATFGANIEASTTSALGQDIIAFARSDGLFGGAALEGTSITPKVEWNEAIYGAGANPQAILFERRWLNADADPLYASLLPRAPRQASPSVTPNPNAMGGGAGSAPAPTAQPPMDRGQGLPPVERQTLE